MFRSDIQYAIKWHNATYCYSMDSVPTFGEGCHVFAPQKRVCGNRSLSYCSLFLFLPTCTARKFNKKYKCIINSTINIKNIKLKRKALLISFKNIIILLLYIFKCFSTVRGPLCKQKRSNIVLLILSKSWAAMFKQRIIGSFCSNFNWKFYSKPGQLGT